jgi:serine/threonine protein kinase
MSEAPSKTEAQPPDPSWLAQYYTSEKTTILSRRAAIATTSGDPPRLDSPVDLTPCSVEKYTILGLIGAGGMKVVHKVQDKDTTRTIAMATVRGSLREERDLRRFVHEARVTAVLEHPNIVPIHDLGVDAAGRPYFTMKMLEGESLEGILKKIEAGDAAYREKHNLTYLLGIFQKICDAVAFAHSRRVVHLDLKPANVQVSAFGEVLVIDWGLAKFLDSQNETPEENPAAPPPPASPERTLEGAVKGTPGYMAPEQARGDNSRKDTRTDIYSLGAILYAILTLRSPAAGNEVDRILADTIAGRILPPRARAPDRDIPAALDAVAMKALSADPDRRYRSVEELNRDVSAFLRGFATSAQEVGFMTLLWLLIKRHKWTSLLIAFSAAAIAVLTTVAVFKIKASETEAVEALARYRAEHETARQLGKVAAPQFFIDAEKQIRDLKFEEASRTLNLVLASDGAFAVAWPLKGCLHMAREEFGRAAEAFHAIPLPPEPPKPPEAGGKKKSDKPEPKKRMDPEAIARKYQAMAGSGNSRLTNDQFLELVADVSEIANQQVPRLRPYILASLFRNRLRAQTANEEYLSLVRRSLQILNPRTDPLEMEHTIAETSVFLTLRGKNIANLAPLLDLPVVSLDLKGIGVQDLVFLKGMPLAYLDISETQVRDLVPVLDAPLKELRVVGCKSLDLNVVQRLTQLETLVASRDVIPPKVEAYLRKDPDLRIELR